MPELPWVKKQRLIINYNIPEKGANLFIQNETALAFFEATIKELQLLNLENSQKAIILAYNYLVTDILGIKEKENLPWENIKISPQNFAQLVKNLVLEKISSRAGKDILLEIIHTNQDVEKIIKEKGLEKISDQSVLISTINEIIKNNPKAIEDYKKGKENTIQFLVGQAMAKLRGTADPQELEKLIREKITG